MVLQVQPMKPMVTLDFFSCGMWSGTALNHLWERQAVVLAHTLSYLPLACGGSLAPATDLNSQPTTGLIIWSTPPIHCKRQPSPHSQNGSVTWKAQGTLGGVTAWQLGDSVVLSSSYKSAQSTCCRDKCSSGFSAGEAQV